MYKCTFTEVLPFILKVSKHVVIKIVSMKKIVNQKSKNRGHLAERHVIGPDLYLEKIL